MWNLYGKYFYSISKNEREASTVNELEFGVRSERNNSRQKEKQFALMGGKSNICLKFIECLSSVCERCQSFAKVRLEEGDNWEELNCLKFIWFLRWQQSTFYSDVRLCFILQPYFVKPLFVTIKIYKNNKSNFWYLIFPKLSTIFQPCFHTLHNHQNDGMHCSASLRWWRTLKFSFPERKKIIW